jgi:hypothetical protein
VARRKQRARALDLAVLEAETARLQVESLRSELTALHHELARRDVEMVSALTRMSTAAEALHEAAERDREGQRRLARAVELLAVFAAAPPPNVALATTAAPSAGTPEPRGTSVIGGSVDPTRAVPTPPTRRPTNPAPELPDDPLPPAAHDSTIDLTAELPIAPATRAEAPLQCEVHLQFGDRWIDGFQIEETLSGPEGVQFRLRRRVDGWVLPELFAESEVRVFTQPIVEAQPTVVRNWPAEPVSRTR